MFCGGREGKTTTIFFYWSHFQTPCQYCINSFVIIWNGHFYHFWKCLWLAYETSSLYKNAKVHNFNYPCLCVWFFWTKQWFTSSSPSSWVLGYCVEKDDRRWAPMCSHSLNGPVDSGLMMGKEECTSPSGYYELLIPVNKKLDCSATKMKDTNCKDLDVSLRRLSCLWLMTYVFRDGEVLRVLVNTNVTAFSQAESFGFLVSWGCPADQTARRLCLRDWCGLGSSPTSTPRLNPLLSCRHAGGKALRLF